MHPLTHHYSPKYQLSREKISFSIQIEDLETCIEKLEKQISELKKSHEDLMRLQELPKYSSVCCKELSDSNGKLHKFLQELSEDNKKLNFQCIAEDDNTASGKKFPSDEQQYAASMNGNGHEHETEEDLTSHESFSIAFSKDEIEEQHLYANAEYLDFKGENSLQAKACESVPCRLVRNGSSQSAEIEDQCSFMAVAVRENTDGRKQDFKLRGGYFSFAKSSHLTVNREANFSIIPCSMRSYCI